MAKDLEFAAAAAANTQLDAKAQTEDRVSKVLKLWEKKSAKRAAKAAGLPIMLLSLAACGGGGSESGSSAAPTSYSMKELLDALRDGSVDEAFSLREESSALGSLNVSDLEQLEGAAANANNVDAFIDAISNGEVTISFSLADTAENVLAFVADKEAEGLGDLVQALAGDLDDFTITDEIATLTVSELSILQDLGASFDGQVRVVDTVENVLAGEADFAAAVVTVTEEKITAEQFEALSEIDGFELGNVVVVYTLEEALAAQAAGKLADNYDIDPETLFDAGVVNVEQALAAYAQVDALIADAKNSADVALGDVFAWSVTDTSENVLANKTAAAVVGAAIVTVNVTSTAIGAHNQIPGVNPLLIELDVNGAVVVNAQTNTRTSDGGFDIEVGNSDVTVNLGSSDDVVRIVSEGAVTVNAVSGTSSDNITIVGSGDATVNVGAGDDTVITGSGDDRIVFAAGQLNENDFVDAGDGYDTVVISGEGNVVNASNLVNVERLELEGTVVTIDIAALEGGSLEEIVGNSETSEVIITGTPDGAALDLSGFKIENLKSVTVDSSITLVLTVDQIENVGAFVAASGETLTVQTDVAGFTALGQKAADATIIVRDTAENIDAAGDALSGVLVISSEAVTVAEALRALEVAGSANFGLSDTAANLALAPVSVFNSAAAVVVAGKATHSQANEIAATLNASNENRGGDNQLPNFGASTVTMHIEDTSSMLANYASAAAFHYADTVVATDVATVAEAVAIYNEFSEAEYAVEDSASNILDAIGTQAAALSAATVLEITNLSVLVWDVVAINSALSIVTGGLSTIVPGYVLTDSFSNLTSSVSVAKTAAINAASEVIVDEPISVAQALVVNSLGGGQKSFVIEDNYLFVRDAIDPLVNSATSVSLTDNPTLTVAQINALHAKWTEKLSADSISVSDSFVNLLTLSTGSVGAASVFTVTSGTANVAQLAELSALTEAKMPTVVVADSASALADAAADEDLGALLVAKASSVTVQGIAQVSQIEALVDAGVDIGHIAFSLSDSAENLEAAVSVAADAITVTGAAATVSQIEALVTAGVDIADITFSLSDSAENLQAAVSVAIAADAITVTGSAATVAQIEALVTAGVDVNNVTFNLSDNVTNLGANNTVPAKVDLLNAAGIITVTDTIANIADVNGELTVGAALADVIVAKDTLPNLTAASNAQKDAVTSIVISGAVDPASPDHVSQVNALSAIKPTTYDLTSSTFAELTSDAVGVATFVAGAASVEVSDQITPDQYNQLDALNSGTLSAPQITGTVAQLSAATAETAVTNATTVILTGSTEATVAQAQALLDWLDDDISADILKTIDIVDSAAAIQGASSELLAAVDSITPPDGAVLTLSVANALAVYDRADTSDGSITNNQFPDGSARAEYHIIDTAANIAAAPAALLGFAASVNVTTAATVAEAATLAVRESMGGEISFNIVDTFADVFSGDAIANMSALDAAGDVRVVVDTSAETLVTATLNLAQATALNAAENSGTKTYGLSESGSVLASVRVSRDVGH